MHNRFNKSNNLATTNTASTVIPVSDYHRVESRGFEVSEGFSIVTHRTVGPDVTDPRYKPKPETKKPDSSCPSTKTEYYASLPEMAVDDMGDDRHLKELNKGMTWLKYCEDLLKQREKEEGKKRNNKNKRNSDDSDSDTEETESSADKAIVFHFGFPNVLTLPEKIHHRTLHFSLSSENQLKNADIFKKLDDDASLKFVLNGSLLADNENLIKNKLIRYHWKPLHIRLIEEHNRLPISLDMQLTTKIPDNAEESKVRQEWVSPTGISNSGIVHYVSVPGTKRISKSDQVSLYVADEALLNSADANRWLEVDEILFKQTLAGFRQGQFYLVAAPELDHYIAANPVQFLVITEFKRLIELSAKLDPPEILGEGNNRKSIKVHQEPLDFIAAQKFQLYNKNKLLMRVEDFELSLTPINTENWKIDLEAYMSRCSKNMMSENNVPQYTAKIEIAYENYSANSQYRSTAIEAIEAVKSPSYNRIILEQPTILPKTSTWR